MFFVLIQQRHALGVVHLVIHPHPDKPFPLNLGENLPVLAFLPPNNRGAHLDPCPFRTGQDRIDNLRSVLTADDIAADPAVRRAGAGKQHTAIVVNLRRGRYGRTRIARGAPLFDGDGRRQALNVLDLRLLHLLQKLAGIGTERFDILPLALGIDGIERQRTLARTAHAGHHDEPVPRDIDVDILQIMFTRPGDADDLWLAHDLTRFSTLVIDSFFLWQSK